MTLKRVELSHIEPLSLGKVNAIFGFVVGLLAGLGTLISSGIVADYLQTLTNVDPQLIVQTQQFGFFGLLLFLFMGIIFGFISGALAAVIYNAVVKMVGGIKIEFEAN